MSISEQCLYRNHISMCSSVNAGISESGGGCGGSWYNPSYITTTGNIKQKQCICCQSWVATTCVRGACVNCHQQALCHDDV
jgi:hypothetical protein